MRAVITNLPIRKTIELLGEKYDSLDETGSFFAMLATEYDGENNVSADIFDVISAGVARGYDYVNTIVYPTAARREVSFSDNVRYVVWLCRDHRRMTFDKDAIREKHIWKDVEWGKRTKNYSPKGKDPGNVWIPTEDDGHATITEHILLDDAGVLDRLMKMAGGGDCEVIGSIEASAPAAPRIAAAEKKPPDAGADSARGTVVFGSSEDMAQVKNGSVRLAVTSPPYWNLKDYFKAGQIGQEEYEPYLERMRAVWRQCYDKLTDDGSLWININIRRQKDAVILLPRDFISICAGIGFFYKGIVIWHKSSGIPTGDKNIVDRHEYVLVFSKGKTLELDRAFLSDCGDYKNDAMNGGAIWNINRKAGSVGKKYIHPAIYPNELVRRIVLAASRPGDTVLDPFLGSGTTLIASVLSGRACVGYEYNEGFRELIESRLATDGVPASHVLFSIVRTQ